MPRYNPFHAEPPCEDPLKDHPFTVVLWIYAELVIGQVYAKTSAEAIKNVADDFFNGTADLDEVEIITVLYGHCEICMVEDELGEFKWFK